MSFRTVRGLLMLDMVTIFGSWPQYLVACLVMVVAQGVYVSFGFGVGLMAIGLLALVFAVVQDVVVVLLLVTTPVELFVLASSHRHISWRGTLWIAMGVAVGTPLGAVALWYGEPLVLLTLLGGVLVIVGLGFLALQSGFHVAWGRWVAPVAGLLSGVLGGLFGVGGPPLIVYYQLSGVNKSAFRANLIAIFLLIGLLRLPLYAASGLLTVPRLWSALALAPAIVLGAWLGSRFHVKMSEDTFRRSISVAVVAIGLLLLLRQ